MQDKKDNIMIILDIHVILRIYVLETTRLGKSKTTSISIISVLVHNRRIPLTCLLYIPHNSKHAMICLLVPISRMQPVACSSKFDC